MVSQLTLTSRRNNTKRNNPPPQTPTPGGEILPALSLYGNRNSCSGRRVACRRFKKIAAGTACLYRKSLTTDNTDVCCRGCVNRLRLCLTRAPLHRRRG